MVRGRKPHQLGPRVFRPPNSRWWKVDLRPWGGPRTVLLSPEDPGWPAHGQRTEREEVAEAWKWAYYRLVQSDHLRRSLQLPARPRPLGEVAEGYLSTRKHTVEANTWGSDRTAIGHLMAYLPHGTTTAELSPELLQRLFLDLITRGYRPSTLRTYLISLRVFLGSFDRAYLVDAVQLPHPGREDVATLGWEDLRRVRMAADRVDQQQVGLFPSARLAVEVGLAMGLRQGEIFALRWDDLSPETHSVRIQRQVPKDGITPKPLKGKMGRTALVLPSWWERHTGGIGLMLGKGGDPVGSRTQRNLITRVLDTAGLNQVGMGWHVLRHTYARLCLEEYGVSLEELQRFLGHTSIRTTEDSYGHFRPSAALERAARKVYGQG